MSGPSIPTIKRLFAVSSNRCAFPNCPNQIVDPTTGAVVGHICHIKARSADGPRFDVRQTDLERHSFENLLLMCPTHHTSIDSAPEKYTVEVLLKIKTEHEASSTIKLDSNDEIATRLVQNTYHMDVQSAIVQVQGKNVSIGLSYSDVRQIAQDIFEANFYRLFDYHIENVC